MQTFIMAMNITSDARKIHSDLANQINISLEAFAENKIKVQGLYATLGRFECLAIFEVEDQTMAFKVASQINAHGVLETETWPVIPFEDFSRLLG